MRLASQLQENDDLLYLSPQELPEITEIGNQNQWQELLALEPTKHYITQRITQITQVAQRKALQALQEQAKNGNVQAIKEINELSGIMQKRDNNRIIVLHKIERPTNLKEETK